MKRVAPALLFRTRISPWSKYWVQTRVYETEKDLQRAARREFGPLRLEDPRQRERDKGDTHKMIAMCSKIRKDTKYRALWRRNIRAVVLVHREGGVRAGTLAHEYVHAAMECCRCGLGTDPHKLEENIATMTGWLLSESIPVIERDLRCTVRP